MHSEFCKTQDQWRQICSTHRSRMHRMWKRIAKVNLERSDMSLVQDYTDGGDINFSNGNLLFYTCICGCDVLSQYFMLYMFVYLIIYMYQMRLEV